MACRACTWARQFALNVGIVTDRGLNVLLLGDPNETLSQRTARARVAGSRWAAWTCRVLSFLSRLFGERGDHCEWALAPGTSGAELWAWSDPPAAANEEKEAA
jgi:hypothetical protein